MALNDPLASVLSAVQNAEQRGKKAITTTSNSKLVRKVLDIMVAEGYVEGYDVTPDAKGDLLTVRLLGRINKTGVVKPRHQIKKGEYERFEKRFLPARGFGVIIISTVKGLMTHEQAKQLNLGGTLISYCY
jgi:small subunit ribosomal protein S8